MIHYNWWSTSATIKMDQRISIGKAALRKGVPRPFSCLGGFRFRNLICSSTQSKRSDTVGCK